MPPCEPGTTTQTSQPELHDWSALQLPQTACALSCQLCHKMPALTPLTTTWLTHAPGSSELLKAFSIHFEFCHSIVILNSTYCHVAPPQFPEKQHSTLHVFGTPS
jgi:hypothetical protein